MMASPDPGFLIEVFNVLGAGDGFMSGLLKGWISGDDWVTCLTYANACGAFAVSRHGCTPAYPSWEELNFFLKRGLKDKALRKDKVLEQIHWSTNRLGTWDNMHVFAFDHRVQLEQMADDAKVSHDHIGYFKKLCLEAASKVADGKEGYGILCDSRLGRDALYQAAGTGLWIGHPVEWPASRPLKLEPEIGADFGGLAEWPNEHVVKVLCFYHPDDSDQMKAEQEGRSETSVRSLPPKRSGTVDGGNPFQGGFGRRRDDGSGYSTPLRHRHLSGLVEAGANDVTQGLGKGLRCD